MIPKKLDVEKFNYDKNKMYSGTINEMKLFVELIEYLRENKEFFTEYHDTKLYSLFGSCEFNDDEFWNYANLNTEYFFEEFGEEPSFKFRSGRGSFYIKFTLYDEYYDELLIDPSSDRVIELLQEACVDDIAMQINEFIDAVNFIERVKKPNNFKNYLKEIRG